jgi:hypothetical protein
MKKLLIMLLFTMTTFAQTTTIKGVTLTYNKVNKTLLLTMIDDTFIVPDDSDLDTQVRILRKSLPFKISGTEYTMTETCFITSGYKHPMFWAYSTETFGNCSSTKKDNVYKFTDVQPGEYIIEVTRRCDEKYVINTSTKSLIIK